MSLRFLPVAVALAFAGSAYAQQGPATTPRTDAKAPAASGASGERRTAGRDARNVEEDRIEAEAKAAREKCDALQGNAEDICEKEAEGREKVAKAELRAKQDPSPRNQRRAAESRVEADYEVAKERCDDLKGEQKNACQKDARTQRDQARAGIKKQYAQRQERAASTGETRAGGGTK